MQKQKGFSLIELLIVVAIILIIAAIGIPYLIRSQASADEASAVASMRTLLSANSEYSNTYGIGYAAALANLGGAAPCTSSSATACIIDPALTTGNKSGYTFTSTPAGGAGTVVSPFTTVEIDASPVNPGITGQRAFCADQTGVIHYNTTGVGFATAAGTCAASGAPIVQ